jgi:hypothetical protein
MVGVADVSTRRFSFRGAAVAVGASSALFLVWVTVHLGGDWASTVVDDVGQLVAAAVAAVVCSFAGLDRRLGPGRVGWGLLGASALMWAAGEAAWCWYELVQKVAVPFPSLADVGFLTAGPLAIGGLLAFLPAARVNGNHRRLVIATLTVSVISFFILVLILGSSTHQNGSTEMGRIFGLAYPVSDMILATVVIRVIRAGRGDHTSLILVLAGVLCFTISDTSFAYETAANTYGIGNSTDTGWVLGYFLMALGALWLLSDRDRTRNFAADLPPVPLLAAATKSYAAVPNSLASKSRLTPRLADHLVNGSAIVLILLDTGVSLYDLVTLLGALT